MKNTLRIIISRYIGARNTRCSSNEVGGKLPKLAMVQYRSTPRISVLKPRTGLNFRSNFEGYSLSVNSLYSAQESGADRVIGAVSFVCFLTLLAVALGA